MGLPTWKCRRYGLPLFSWLSSAVPLRPQPVSWTLRKVPPAGPCHQRLPVGNFSRHPQHIKLIIHPSQSSRHPWVNSDISS